MTLIILAGKTVDAGWLLYCLTIAGLGMFFQECMKPNMIFRRYYLWLTFIWIKSWRRKNRWKRWLLKPLGLCIYCNTTWIAIAFYLFWFPPALEILLFIGLVFIMVKALEKLLHI